MQFHPWKLIFSEETLIDPKFNLECATGPNEEAAISKSTIGQEARIRHIDSSSDSDADNICALFNSHKG